MIVSGKPKPSNSRWLQATVLTLAALMIPCGNTYSQDYRTVKKLERAFPIQFTVRLTRMALVAPLDEDRTDLLLEEVLRIF